MRRHFFVALFFLISCGTNRTEDSKIELLNEAPVFTQKERRITPYQIETCGWKRRPCLIQSGNISSDFVVHFNKEPLVSYMLLTTGHSNFDGRIVIESDHPSPLRMEIKAVNGSPQTISLNKFEDRTSRIQFVTRLNGSGEQRFEWIDPVIHQRSHRPRTANHKGLSQLRKLNQNSNVFIIVFDAAGSSHFSSYGYPKNTTPVSDTLAKEGVLWERAVSHAASTVASTGSLLTGLYPAEHRALLSNSVLHERFETMPELFRKYGYRTALFTGNPYASPLIGYGQGFDHIWNPRLGRVTNAEDFVPAVNSWIEKHKDRKLFAYLHFREPHSPFKPPSDLWKAFDPGTDFTLPGFFIHEIPKEKDLRKIVAAYDANLASVDRQMGHILSHMKKSGIWNNSIIILLSDHGEAFWEHGKQGHNYPLFEEIIRIPFIIRFPNTNGIAGKRVATPAGSIDVFPTLVDLLQFSRRGRRWSGVSLLPSIYQDGAEERFLISQTARRRIYSARWRNFKYVWHKEDGVQENELYQLDQDPLEKVNLIHKFPILASYLHLQLQKFLHTHSMLHRPRTKEQIKENPKMDRETEEELRALGYID